MAITYAYPTVAPELQDLLIGTEMAIQGGEDTPRTRTFTIGSIVDLVEANLPPTTAPGLQQVTTAGDTTTNRTNFYTTGATAIRADSNGDSGIVSTSIGGYGIYAASNIESGVYGTSESGFGVQAYSGSGTGIIGSSGTGVPAKFSLSAVNPSNIAEFLKNGVPQAIVQNDGKITAAAGTEPTDVIVKSQLDSVRPYKVYTALLTQSGINPPTPTVLENTLGGIVVWTYDIEGIYNATLTGAFLPNKTVVFCTKQMTGSGGLIMSGSRTSYNTVSVRVSNSIGNSDGELDNASIEIRVYN